MSTQELKTQNNRGECKRGEQKPDETKKREKELEIPLKHVCISRGDHRSVRRVTLWSSVSPSDSAGDTISLRRKNTHTHTQAKGSHEIMPQTQKVFSPTEGSLCVLFIML